MKIKKDKNLLIGLTAAIALGIGGILLYKTQKCGILRNFFRNQCGDNSMYDIGSASTMDPDPFITELEMATRPITDDWVQQ